MNHNYCARAVDFATTVQKTDCVKREYVELKVILYQKSKLLDINVCVLLLRGAPNKLKNLE